MSHNTSYPTYLSCVGFNQILEVGNINLIELSRTGLAVLKKFTYDHQSKVNFSVTYKCNQRCQTCNIWNIYEKNPESEERECSLEEFRAFFEKNRNLIWASFTGGEPFLRKDISDILCLANSIKGLKIISITTNGTLPRKTENDIQKVLGSPRGFSFFISISLNGPEIIHDDLSGIKGSYQKALETFRRLSRIECSDNRLKVGFEYTLSRFNAGRFEDTLKNLAEEGITIGLDRFTFAVAQQSPYYYLPAEAQVSPNLDMLNRELNWIVKRYPKNFFKNPLGLVPYTYLKFAIEYANKRERLPCTAVTHSCFIDPYGTVYPCVFMPSKLGELRSNDFSLDKILRRRESAEVRRSLKKDCEGCWTPCEAYQAIIFKPYLLFKTLGGD